MLMVQQQNYTNGIPNIIMNRLPKSETHYGSIVYEIDIRRLKQST